MNKSTKAIDENIYQQVMSRLKSNIKTCDIVKEFGINRSTVNSWKRSNGRVGKSKTFLRDSEYINFGDIEYLKHSTQKYRECYSYVLGMYLGCGNIYKQPRTFKLTIDLDKTFDSVVEYTVNIFKEFFCKKVSVFYGKTKRYNGHVCINTHSNDLLTIFPQHSLGKKETRNIKLVDWQEDIIVSNMLLKGLIVSCGSVFVNTNDHKINIKIKHRSNDVVDIFEHYAKHLGFNYSRYMKFGYSVLDVTEFEESLLENVQQLIRSDNNDIKIFDNFNERIFENIDTKEKAYWLGFLYADGNICKTSNRVGFHLAYKDVVLLERFCDFVGGDRSKIISYDNNSSVCFYVYSKNFKNDLINNNIVPNKTYEKIFPIIKDYELFLAFFLGVYDGDGSQGSTSLASGNKEFLEHCCERLDISKDKIKYKINHLGSCYTLIVGKKRYDKILINYENSLDRKRYKPFLICDICEKKINTRSKLCKKCADTTNKQCQERFEVSKEELEKLVSENPMTEIGKIFGVSDNAIRKRCKKLGIVLEKRAGYWTKVKYDKL